MIRNFFMSYRKVLRALLAWMSNSFEEWSMDPETKKSPVSWNATDQTGWVWSLKVCAQLMFKKSQILIVESPEAVA
jgi:hypothetical protein